MANDNMKLFDAMEVDLNYAVERGTALALASQDDNFRIPISVLKEQQDSISNLQTDIMALGGALIYLAHIEYTTAQVTANNGILTQWCIDNGKDPLKRGYCLIDKNLNDWWCDGENWTNIGFYEVSTATTSSLGVVKSSNTDLKVYVNTDGTMSVNNLSTKLNAKLNNDAPIDGRIYGRRNGAWRASKLSGVMTDLRDGKMYRTVEMPDGKLWMAENLDYSENNVGVYYGNNTTPGNQPPFPKAGRLYTYDEALTVAPPGWHLPSDGEWMELVTAIGGAAGGGTKLKATARWNMNGAVSGNGTDDYQFTGLPSGHRSTNSVFLNVGNYGYWWSSTANDASNALIHYLNYNDNVERFLGSKMYSFSVRCVKD